MFVCIVVSSVGVCLFDRCSVRVDRAYGRAIGNLKSVVDKLNEEGRLLEECGVVLSVVLTGPMMTKMMKMMKPTTTTKHGIGQGGITLQMSTFNANEYQQTLLHNTAMMTTMTS